MSTSTRSESLHGLSEAEVRASRARHGSNTLYLRPKRQFWHIILEIIREPIFLLLVLGCGLYFVIGDSTEAWLMMASIGFVIGIELIQERRSEKALEALREFAQPKVTVRRSGQDTTVAIEELVVDDLMVFAEGERLAADGLIVQQNDLSIDEAVLTGESLPATKSVEEGQNRVFQGTVVTSGLGIARVQAIGAQSEFGKLGKSIEAIESEPTPLQVQIDRFVKQMMLVGLVAFLIVFGINYYYIGAILAALLFSLAFALALIPEEIPVAFTTFMALGAYRMTKQNILVKQPKTVESLGSATVICLDKTGTITENQMSVAEVVDFSGKNLCLEYAMWASEPTPFDAMEKAIHTAYAEKTPKDRRPGFELIHEYPLSGVPPMMTHVFDNGHGERIVATKGALERILLVCRHLDDKTRTAALKKTHELAAKGYRILGVASAAWPGDDFPADQDAFPWQFEGVIALYDPPKKNIQKVFQQFYKAGIRVKMITGDYPETALNIAGQSGLQHDGSVLSGEAVMAMSETELQHAVGATNVFARMFPDAKLRVVEALKANGEVVAMTGDGVNDGPALKSAQIGVAMGRRGTEIAKGAASMVLLDDDLKRMVTAIKMGRKIYNNLRKAIRYIISVHVPIVLVVILPLVFGWPYLHMLAPIHVIFLELIMDPTCAVAFENEPAEPNLLSKPPRPANAPLFTGRELTLSIIQGLVVTAGIFFLYHYAIAQGASEGKTRSFVFLTMMAANIFLTLTTRSFDYTIAQTLFFKNRLMVYILGISTAMMAAILFVPGLNHLFKMEALSLGEIGLCLGTALVSVGWFEVWKALQPRVGGGH
ncbi:MAG: cation-translocating P-type ATPase [Saprospiraceae bacterium]|nr:cation-translocating P-type ATPase [Saprospiraceae bacterium]